MPLRSSMARFDWIVCWKKIEDAALLVGIEKEKEEEEEEEEFCSGKTTNAWRGNRKKEKGRKKEKKNRWQHETVFCRPGIRWAFVNGGVEWGGGEEGLEGERRWIFDDAGSDAVSPVAPEIGSESHSFLMGQPAVVPASAAGTQRTLGWRFASSSATFGLGSCCIFHSIVVFLFIVDGVRSHRRKIPEMALENQLVKGWTVDRNGERRAQHLVNPSKTPSNQGQTLK